MKRSLAFLAAIGLVACATSTAPPDDGVVFGAGVEAGDEGNPYGGGDDGGASESGDPMTDSGVAPQDASATDTGTPADSGATDTGTMTAPGVCAKTTLQGVEYAADIFAGTGTDCTSSPTVCAAGECCYPSSILALCVTE
jgi:hypothetical protein